MIGIGNLDIDKLYVGNDDVEKIYFGDNLVYEKNQIVVDTVLRINTPSQKSLKLRLKKTNDSPNEIYVNNVLNRTLNTIGSEVINFSVPAGDNEIKITGNKGKFYFDSYCLYDSTNNSYITDITLGTNYDNIIGSYAFYNCSNPTSINIPKNITEIQSNAFYNCQNITSITIPTGVKSIGNSAFYNCKKLVEINYNAIELTSLPSTSSNIFYSAGINKTGITLTFGNSVKKIPDYLFYVNNNNYVPKIKTINIPTSVISIGRGAFNNCKYIEEINYNSKELTTSINGANYVPFSKIGLAGNGITVNFGNSVEKIPDYLFYSSSLNNASNITNVIMGNNITEIGKYAFQYGKNITNLQFGTSVQLINDYAFKGCQGLINLSIPETVEIINNYAFSDCTNLTNVFVTNNLKYLGYSPFDNCSNINYNSYDNAYYLGDNNNLYIALIKSVDTTVASCNINQNTKIIGGSAFENCSLLENISIPNSIVCISAGAFRNCSILNNVTIPNSVEIIGDYAFYHCDSFTSISIPNTIIEIKSGAFAYCSSVTGTLTIPNSVEILGNSAFSHCSGITSVVLGNGLTYLGEYAFSTCENITSITFPNKKINNIGSSVFSNCSGLTGTLTIPNVIEKISPTMFYGCSGLTDIIIEEGVIEIQSGAFQYCSALENVSIPNSVMKIAGNLFYECPNIIYNQYDNGYYLGNNDNHNLIFIKAIDTSLSSCIINQNTKFIYQSACSNYSALTGTLTIPDNVIDIGAIAFQNCTGLTGILTIPNSTISIGQSAFNGCNNFNSLILGNHVKTVANSAFYNCSGFSNILTIPDSMEDIGYMSFYGCSGLTNLNIGTGVINIAAYSFYGCQNLIDITINKITPPTLADSSAFNNTNNCPICVPASSINAYKSATNWSTYSSRIQAIIT